MIKFTSGDVSCADVIFFWVIGQAEAMNNIGTTMKALSRNDQAYEWWWKAIQLRPTYWDAIVRAIFYFSPLVLCSIRRC